MMEMSGTVLCKSNEILKHAKLEGIFRYCYESLKIKAFSAKYNSKQHFEISVGQSQIFEEFDFPIEWS